MGIDTLTNEERRQLLLSVGTHRGQRPLSPFEVAELFARAISKGATLAECAAAASLEGTTWVSRFLRLLKLPSTVTHLVDWGGGSGTIGLNRKAQFHIERLARRTYEFLFRFPPVCPFSVIRFPFFVSLNLFPFLCCLRLFFN